MGLAHCFDNNKNRVKHNKNKSLCTQNEKLFSTRKKKFYALHTHSKPESIPASVLQNRVKIRIIFKSDKVNRFTSALVYLYHMYKRALASSHPTNYLVDLCWLAQLIHSFLVVAQFQHHEYYLMMSIRNESFYRFYDFPNEQQKLEREKKIKVTQK